jgi:hypothetical protein
MARMRLAFLLLAVAAAAAPEPSAEKKWRALFDVCRTAAEKHCAEAPHVPAPLVDCLKPHEDELAPRCRSAWKEASLTLEEIRRMFDLERDCKLDGEKFCPGKSAGDGLLGCIDDHKDAVLSVCLAAYARTITEHRSGPREFARMGRPDAAAEKEWRPLERACRPEAASYCRGVPHWKGYLIECLEAREGELSKGCRSAWGAARETFLSDKKVAYADVVCRPDGAKRCPGLSFGTGLGDCLLRRPDELSVPCREAMDVLRAEYEKVRAKARATSTR